MNVIKILVNSRVIIQLALLNVHVLQDTLRITRVALEMTPVSNYDSWSIIIVASCKWQSLAIV